MFKPQRSCLTQFNPSDTCMWESWLKIPSVIATRYWSGHFTGPVKLRMRKCHWFNDYQQFILSRLEYII